jgi:hypothetical protein
MAYSFANHARDFGEYRREKAGPILAARAKGPDGFRPSRWSQRKLALSEALRQTGD